VTWQRAVAFDDDHPVTVRLGMGMFGLGRWGRAIRQPGAGRDRQPRGTLRLGKRIFEHRQPAGNCDVLAEFDHVISGVENPPLACQDWRTFGHS
jgi:hypothetical protein